MRVVHCALIKLIAPLPTAATITRAKDTAFAIGGFDSRIDHVRINRRDRQSNAAQLNCGQSHPQLVPGGAGVGRLVNGAFGPAINQRPVVTTSLVSSRVDRFRMQRVYGYVSDAGVL